MSKKIFLTILILCGIANFCYATTFDNQIINNTLVDTIYGNDISGQTFIPTSAYNSYGLKVWLRNNSKNVLNVYLCNSINGVPERNCYLGVGTSTALAVSTFYASSVVPSTILSGSEYHIIFNDLSSLISTTTNREYAFVLTLLTATTGSNVALYGGSGNPYSTGKFIYSNNGGLTWSSSTDDLYFKLYGILKSTTTDDMCTCTTTLDYISNTTTGAGFWLDSSISYGDMLVSTFLLVILLIFVVQFIFKLELPQRVKIIRIK